MPDFQIDTEGGDASATVKLTGELDGASADALSVEFDRLLAAGGRTITLDLSAVSFIDSAGLRAIIQIQQLGLERNTLTVLPPPAPLLELLDVTGLAERLHFTHDAGSTTSEHRYLERIDMRLPRDPSAPGLARAELRQAVEARLGEAELGAAVLLASELVTNAVLHASQDNDDPIEFRISSYPDRVRIDVIDAGPGFDPNAIEQGPRKPESGGRGLLVVDRLATRWGIRPGPEGDERFCVWYELELESDQPSRPDRDAAET